MNRLILVDGNAILHRAFHALPPLTDPDGNVVNAVYGFTSMLFRIVSDLQPTHIAVCFDRPAPTFRKKLFVHYQATRPKMDTSLVPQVDKVHELLAAFGIPIFELDGYEADDMIGTLAKKSKDQVIIVTGDRDLLQLVSDEKVLVSMPVKGLSETKIFGEKEVMERMGVSPKQIPDYKALAGDSSDNYPGIPGVGPKTAVALLSKYKTIDNVLKNEKFTDPEKESARLCHDLATIRTDAPVDLSSLVPFTSLDKPASRAFLQKLGFKSLHARLTGEPVAKKKPEKKEKNDQQLSLV